MSSQLDNPQVITQAIKRCLDFVEQFAKRNLNINGNRVTNAGDAIDNSDYVTLAQLKKLVPTVTTVVDYRTIVWSNASDSLEDDLPWYRFGLHLDSKPIELWIKCDIAPISDTLILDLQYAASEEQSATSILNTPITLQIGDSFDVTSSFDSSIFAEGGIIRPLITQGGGASNVSIGLVVQRT